MRAEDILPDDQNHVSRNGVVIRKGSVGAFLASARLWADPTTPEPERGRAGRDMRAILPALQALGLFEVLAVRDPALAAYLGLDDQGVNRA